jgi:hypothetical protein
MGHNCEVRPALAGPSLGTSMAGRTLQLDHLGRER